MKTWFHGVMLPAIFGRKFGAQLATLKTKRGVVPFSRPYLLSPHRIDT
jgi:hypothetical protein